MTLALTLALLAQAPATLAGTWELDPDASDDPGPMMEALGVPGYLRALAPKKPVQVLAVGKDTLSVTTNGMKGKRTEVLTLDGKTPTKGEMMGIAVELVSSVEGDAVVSKGTMAPKGGEKQALVSRRTVSGDRMTVQTSLGSLQMKRVFKRVAK